MQEIFRYKQLGDRPERPCLRPVRGDRRPADVRQPAGIEGLKLPSNMFAERDPDAGLTRGESAETAEFSRHVGESDYSCPRTGARTRPSRDADDNANNGPARGRPRAHSVR